MKAHQICYILALVSFVDHNLASRLLCMHALWLLTFPMQFVPQSLKSNFYLATSKERENTEWIAGTAATEDGTDVARHSSATEFGLVGGEF
jgi:hypothetical protein